MSLDYFLDDTKKLLVDETQYFNLLQDIGFDVRSNKRPKKCSVEKDRVTVKMKAYSNIYEIGSLYYDILHKHNRTFNKLPKNKSAVIQKVCKFIIDPCFFF